jgi:hypothetical protein
LAPASGGGWGPAKEGIKVAERGTCKIEGCGKPVRAKGYCPRHYAKWRTGEYGKTRYKICKMEGCKKRRFQKAYCEDHFKSEFLKKPVGVSGT